MENPIKIHDLGGTPLFLETPIQFHQNPVPKLLKCKMTQAS